ncbi:hypothetical protein IA69_24765 [Massilia sp. JS1662]|nr:DNA translocase FtsK [Massilia sp. JS1662]KGF79380.1 hypothetical protein IA69_24765 [Massilia sp. JS1662]
MTMIPDQSQLVEAARDLVINEQCASVSLLQRHLRIGYSHAQRLMGILESAGIVTAPSAGGFRALTPAFQEGHPSFRDWAVSEFAGCDGGDPLARTWVLGFEHGESAAEGSGRQVEDDGYPIARQRTYRYNRQIFKLLAAIEGGHVSDWLSFAERKRPFVKGASGYFKGNLFPYPCHEDAAWSDAAQGETGFVSKERYRAWCRNHRFPVVEEWIARASPDLIIATGITRRHDFLGVAFQREFVRMEEHRVDVPGRARRFFSASHHGRLLVVLPHLSGSPLFAANATLQAAGAQIAALWRAASTRRQASDRGCAQAAGGV